MLYHSEQQTAKIFSAFSMLAIFLACLGLFALAGYITVQRAKEIGIRKVLGAEIMQIVMLISKDFVKLVALASILAIPLTWLIMNKWLTSYAYHIAINWWLLTLPVFVILLIAIVVISYQTIKVAVTNPVKSLKSE